MWPFTRTKRPPPSIQVPHTEEVLGLQAELADARISHAVTVQSVRHSIKSHNNVIDEALFAFEGRRHVRK